MAKLWIGNKLYSVDSEVQEFVEGLQAKLDRAEYVVRRFEQWYSDNGCPASEKDFCPYYDELKKEHDRRMLELDKEDRYEFYPDENECGYEGGGWCYARYYEKLFDEKVNNEQNKSR